MFDFIQDLVSYFSDDSGSTGSSATPNSARSFDFVRSPVSGFYSNPLRSYVSYE